MVEFIYQVSWTSVSKSALTEKAEFIRNYFKNIRLNLNRRQTVNLWEHDIIASACEQVR